MDTPERSSRELDALFEQSPIALAFGDRELRTRRTNAAFRHLVGLPDEALLGRRPSADEVGTNGALALRILSEQVLGRGVPVIDMHVEQTVAGQRRVLSWSAYRVMDNGQVHGVLGSLTDVTGATGPARSADQLCDSVLAGIGPHGRDDIAMLLARTTAEPARALPALA